MNETRPPEERPSQTTITVGQKQFLWTRLPTTASTELFFELAPTLIPAIMECATLLPMEIVPGAEEPIQWQPFHARDMAGFPDALRKALRELPFARFQAIAGKALKHTSIGNKPLDTKAIDVHLSGTFQYLELVGKALWLQYGDFSDVLEGYGFRLRGQEPSESTELNTSAGPSTES